ncbi:hypothetical protein Mal64_30830 [Pseudobythopirellula maris]|uniref:Uncharacterized protein n=1 Tax=Pseudobythopirellula maris TaxID=2527991 RepID=A0A5C5ZJI4_9BACT|nr:hypothetical protein [Pseudobythopirellula maris]TWT87542.1 hypothetical protein Mal64_30830 [Pseudobythopirellula maris]
MSERERWIIYPLLFLALGAALRDKLLKLTRSQQIVCEQLVVVDSDGMPQTILDGDQMRVGTIEANALRAGTVDAGRLSRGGRAMAAPNGTTIPVNPQQLMQMLQGMRVLPTAPPGAAAIESPAAAPPAEEATAAEPLAEEAVGEGPAVQESPPAGE